MNEFQKAKNHSIRILSFFLTLDNEELDPNLNVSYYQRHKRLKCIKLRGSKK